MAGPREGQEDDEPYQLTLFPFRRWQKSREQLGDRCQCLRFGER